jgi:predicted CXXCH cytochrome family protein
MRTRSIIIAALMAVVGIGVLAAAAEPAATGAGRTPIPVPAKGKGDKCVAPTEWMRRNHMAALMHKRDETMHEGVRTPRFSLKECVSCHAVNGADGKPVTVSDPKHFCRSCHDYAAVSIDCFGCHASRPEPAPKGAALDPGAKANGDVAALGAYLEGRKP